MSEFIADKITELWVWVIIGIGLLLYRSGHYILSHEVYKRFKDLEEGFGKMKEGHDILKTKVQSHEEILKQNNLELNQIKDMLKGVHDAQMRILDAIIKR